MNLPKHIAIIMDGNGRWASMRKQPRNFGHQKGVDALIAVTDYAFSRGIEVMTIYAFSTENWSRPKTEVDRLFSLLRDYFKKNMKRLKKSEVKLQISGDMTKLPEDLQKSCRNAVDLTKDCQKGILNIALNYGARTELARAFNLLIQEGKQNVTEDDIRRVLYTANLPDPDLLIRTSGEQRLSNFLLFQCAYTELYFTNVLWPDFNGEELERAILWYQSRKRNYGNVPKET